AFSRARVMARPSPDPAPVTTATPVTAINPSLHLPTGPPAHRSSGAPVIPCTGTRAAGGLPEPHPVHPRLIRSKRTAWSGPGGGSRGGAGSAPLPPAG